MKLVYIIYQYQNILKLLSYNVTNQSNIQLHETFKKHID